MSTVTIIGAGVMGRGVAQAMAMAGHTVTLYDKSEEALQDAVNEIRQNLRFSSLMKLDMSGTLDDVMDRIHLIMTLSEINSDFVIENITENQEEKSKLYKELNAICDKECILIANTSCISITYLSSFLDNPGKAAGVHFMNPVPMIPAVELIRGEYTTDVTVKSIEVLLETMGKESIVVNDYPGFVSNRISHLMMNEAAFILQEGVALPADIDAVFIKCYGHKMGPLQTADLIGIDTVVDSLDVLFDSYKDSKYRCCPLLRKMVAAGKLGRKVRRGFYEY